MPKSLGIYIEDDIIKYSKVDKNRDVLKIESSGVEFYEKSQIVQTLEKIITESYSAKDTICINISNELYNYFDVFASLNKNDKAKLVDVDFEYFCGEKGYNKDSLESRGIYRNSREDNDKQKVIYISTNKENVYKRMQEFGNVKVSSVTPISTSIFNLVDLGPKDENVLIVNIDKETKVTTIIGGEIYNIDVIPEGMGEILNAINIVENDMKRSYECCKNTTIYTQDMQDLQVNDNEHLEDIMPTLYKLVTEIRKISEGALGQITKIYITGMGTIINNIDLYFQEYIPNSKCELLRPFFLGNNISIKIPIKEYMEVNSATALALDGLGYGEKDLNFRGKSGSVADIKIDSQTIINFFRGLVDPKKKMTAIDKAALRLAICLGVGVIGYGLASNAIVKQIDEKSNQIDAQTKVVEAQIQTINTQTATINSGTNAYNQLYSALDAIKNPQTKDDASSLDSKSDISSIASNQVTIPKNAIPNLLNRIVYIIPQQVRLTSIKNTEGRHIIIEAVAPKYEQLGYFRAALSTSGCLDNVKSTSGTKSGGTVAITIEGDLP